MGGPAVHVAHEQPEGHRRLELVDAVPGVRRGRLVEEHQEDAGHREQHEQEERQTAQTERVGDLHGVPLHLHRVQVVQQAVHDDVRAVAWRVLVVPLEHRAGPEDGVPGLRSADLFVQLGQLLLGGTGIVDGVGHWLSVLLRRPVEFGKVHVSCPLRLSSGRRPPLRASSRRAASACNLPRLFQNENRVMWVPIMKA